MNWVDQGKPVGAQLLTGTGGLKPLQIGLYTVSITWTSATVYTDITEAAWLGYARITLSTWNPPFLNPSHQGDILADPAVFLNTSGSPVVAYGWFYAYSFSGELAGGDEFSSPQTIPATVGTLGLSPEVLFDALP